MIQLDPRHYTHVGGGTVLTRDEPTVGRILAAAGLGSASRVTIAPLTDRYPIDGCDTYPVSLETLQRLAMDWEGIVLNEPDEPDVPVLLADAIPTSVAMVLHWPEAEFRILMHPDAIAAAIDPASWPWNDHAATVAAITRVAVAIEDLTKVATRIADAMPSAERIEGLITYAENVLIRAVRDFGER